MKHRFFRLLSLLLMLCLLRPSALAETAESPENLDGAIRSLFALDDDLYAMSLNGAFYRQVEGGWTHAGEYSTTAIVQSVASGNGAAWLLLRQRVPGDDEDCFQLVRATLDESGCLTVAEPPITIGWDLKPVSRSCSGLVIMDDVAYVLTETPMDWPISALCRVDLTTGEAALVLEAPLRELTGYKDGLLLALRFNLEDTDANGDTLMPQIVTVDPATGELSQLGLIGGYNDGALAYDPVTDSVYFSDNSHVYRVNGSAPETVGYLIPSNMSRQGTAALIHQGRYCLEDYNTLSSAPVDPSLAPQHILRVQRNDDVESVIRDFAHLHPDIAIEFVDGYWSDLDSFTRLMQDETAPDVFVTAMSSNVVTLRDKKYLVDLSSSQVLVDTVSRMYPHLTADLFTDGHLYALPVFMEVYECSGYYPGALEKAGVPLEAIPTTFDELLDFIVTWHNEYFEENEGMEIFEYCLNLRHTLFSMIYSAQIRATGRSGKIVTFNTPTIRRLLNRLDELRPIFDVVSPEMKGNTDDYAYIDNNALFTLDQNMPLPRLYTLQVYDSLPMLLALDEDTPPAVSPVMTVMGVNPYSDDVDAAMELLEYIAQHLDIRFRTAIMPEQTDPIERVNYDDNLDYWRGEIAKLEARMADASDDQRLDLQDQLDRARQRLAALEEEGRWAMTAEEVAWYHENIAPYLTLPTSMYMSSNATDQMYSARSRYVDGQLSAEEFIQEIDRIVWMVQMEHQ